MRIVTVATTVTLATLVVILVLLGVAFSLWGFDGTGTTFGAPRPAHRAPSTPAPGVAPRHLLPSAPAIVLPAVLP
jgi:hypothetical protein